MKKFWIKLTCVPVVSLIATAQTPAPGPVTMSSAQSTSAQSNGANSSATASGTSGRMLYAAADYTLGPDDEIVIRIFEADEISDRPLPIGADGFIGLPMVGRVHVAGMKVEQVQADLTARFAKYINHPQVTVMVSDFRSQPVSLMGAVTSPGVVQLRGKKTLTEVISMGGGLRADAGNAVNITRSLNRGPLPLPGAQTNAGGGFSTATVNLREIMNGKHPELNLTIEPNDVLTVPKAQLIYVLGEVNRAGGFVLDEHDSLSSLQCVSLAGGLSKMANPGKAKILRLEPGRTERTEITANLKKIMNGQSPDVTLHADDILFIPNNLPKSAGLRAAESAIQIGTGIVIWRR